MSLTSNTTALQSILDAVNALPEAGSGGSGVPVATGTFTPSNENYANNPIAITGLGFRPKYVDIMLDAGLTFTLDTSAKTIGVHWDDSLGDKSVYINLAFSKQSYDGSIEYVKSAMINRVEKSLGVVVNDDGFTLQSGRSDYRIMVKKYRYVAIG